MQPMCRLVERESADVYIIACASDPGIDALRAVTTRPVLGIFRSAVAMAIARAERFGVIGLVESSKARHRAALRAMGLEDRRAGEIVLDVSLDALPDPKAARSALIVAAEDSRRWARKQSSSVAPEWRTIGRRYMTPSAFR